MILAIMENRNNLPPRRREYPDVKNFKCKSNSEIVVKYYDGDMMSYYGTVLEAQQVCSCDEM